MFSVPSLSLAFGGRIATTEQWQCTLHFSAVDTFGDPAGQASQLALDGVTALTAFWNSAGIGSLKGGGMSLDYSKAYSYAANATKARAVALRPLALTGNGAAPCPAQVAVVASLRSIDPSRRGKGRIYLPASGLAVNSAGQFDAAVAQAVADSVRNLGVALINSPATDQWLGGTSRSPITSVIVDTIPDTQRRRRNKLTPTARGISLVNV